jgi:deazaflavin-dependent oxidoreductase (nitroreductase family)
MRRPTELAPLVACVLLLTAGIARCADHDDVGAVANESTLEITTAGRTSGQARTATIWFVREGDHIYVQSGKEGQTDWYRNALKTPAVTLRIGTLMLRGRARPVDDAAEVARVHELFEHKYVSARVMGWFGGGFGHGKVLLIDDLEPVH